MTDRDHFAAAALTGLLAGSEHNRDTDALDHAATAYYIADAMLRERGQENQDAAPEARAKADQIMQDQRAEIERLREAIRRLADQDATLSVCDGSVTVTMDATLTDEEREAIADAAGRYVEGITPKAQEYAATLRGLLERTR